MKTRIITMLAVFGVVVGLSSNVSAVTYITMSVGKGDLENFKKEGAEKFCKSGGYARRSNGMFCKFRMGAALAVYACLDKNYEAFKDSECFRKAKSFFSGETNMNSAKAILLDEGRKLGPEVYKLVQDLVK